MISYDTASYERNNFVYIYLINLRTIYCFNLLMIISTLQKNTITEKIYLTLNVFDIPKIEKTNEGK